MAANAADLPGSKDPPFLKRYEGSEIIGYISRSFDRYNLAKPDEKDASKAAWSQIEGQVTRAFYRVPAGHTPLELVRNYEQALSEAGFTRAYEWTSGKNVDSATKFYSQTWEPGNDSIWTTFGLFNSTNEQDYLSATMTKDGQDLTVAIFAEGFVDAQSMTMPPPGKVEKFVANDVIVIVDEVAAKAVENKMVTVQAADMADALASKGSIDLYGILFDTDKSDIKPESTQTLDQIAALLKIDRSLKLEVSGHTDNSGDKAHNQKLSEDRAAAVVDVPVKKYGIDASRLIAKGYGDTQPVAPNDTDANKAKNRRVELKKIT